MGKKRNNPIFITDKLNCVKLNSPWRSVKTKCFFYVSHWTCFFLFDLFYHLSKLYYGFCTIHTVIRTNLRCKDVRKPIQTYCKPQTYYRYFHRLHQSFFYLLILILAKQHSINLIQLDYNHKLWFARRSCYTFQFFILCSNNRLYFYRGKRDTYSSIYGIFVD